MSWDFSTEPEFQANLDWMREFVRQEVWPLDSIVEELDVATIDAALKPLKDQVKAQGLWAAHLEPEHGGQGYGQVKLGLMHEILGTSPLAPRPSAALHPTAATPRSSPSPATTSRRSAGSNRCSLARSALRSR